MISSTCNVDLHREREKERKEGERGRRRWWGKEGRKRQRKEREYHPMCSIAGFGTDLVTGCMRTARCSFGSWWTYL